MTATGDDFLTAHAFTITAFFPLSALRRRMKARLRIFPISAQRRAARAPTRCLRHRRGTQRFIFFPFRKGSICPRSRRVRSRVRRASASATPVLRGRGYRQNGHSCQGTDRGGGGTHRFLVCPHRNRRFSLVSRKRPGRYRHRKRIPSRLSLSSAGELHRGSLYGNEPSYRRTGRNLPRRKSL